MDPAAITPPAPDHTAQIIAIVSAVVIPLATALAALVRAMAKSLYANNRGQNAALEQIQADMAALKAERDAVPRMLPDTYPTTPPPVPRRRKPATLAEKLWPRAVTPLPFYPVPAARGDDDDAK
jgi:hypothetical protein